MIDKQSKDRNFILNIIDDFVKEIIAAPNAGIIDSPISDEELLMIQKGVITAEKKNHLFEIREAIMKEKENTSENVISISSLQKQKAYMQALSTNDLTKAARNEGDMSLQDDEQGFAALQELGLIDDENDEQ